MKKKSFCVPIIFALLLLLIRPVSYQQLEDEHFKNLPDTNLTLYHNDKTVILVKNNSNNSILPLTGALNINPPLNSANTNRKGITGYDFQQKTSINQGLGSSNQGLGSNNQNLGSVSNSSSGGGNPSGGDGPGGSIPGKINNFSSNSTLKPPPELQDYSLSSSPFKSKRQQVLEQIRQELVEAMEEEDRLNYERSMKNRSEITVSIKNGLVLYAIHDQLRDKYHHAPDLNSKLPESLNKSELIRLADKNNYKERLATFRDREVLPEQYVKQYGCDLRRYIIHPNTKMIKGSFGQNMEATNGTSRRQGYHLYNERNGFNAFFDDIDGRFVFRTGFKLTERQKIDLSKRRNVS